MKNKFSYAYLLRRHGSPAMVHRFAVEYAQSLREKHGVPFTWEIVGAVEEVRFSPVLNDKVERVSDEAVAELVLATIVEVVRERQSLFGIASINAILDHCPNVPIATLVGVMRDLMLSGRIRGQVNRQGRVTMVSIP